MSLAKAMGLAAGRNGTGGVVFATFKEYWSNNTINPTITGGNGHASGDLLLTIAGGTSGTPPSIASGWGTAIHSAAHPSGSQSTAAYTRVASASNHTVAWTGQGGKISVWNLGPHAQVDVLQRSTGTSTTFDVTDHAAMAPNCLILAYVITNGAQTDVETTVAATMGLTTRATTKLTAAMTWAGDSRTTYFNSYNPASSTLDTATIRWSAVVVSVKGV
jgi:hypothetical protein